MALLFIIPLLITVTVISIGFAISAPGYSGPATDHFNGKKFRNYDNAKAKGFVDVIKWMISRKQGSWKQIKEEVTEVIPNKTEEKLTVYFVNHSTFLIQWQGINILTDPVWSERASPFSFAGPQRMRPPGIKFENLPQINLILLSHNHYDHLDLQTLKKLKGRDDPFIVLPLGVGVLLTDNGFSKIDALNWWQTTRFNTLEISLVPAQHFSGRGLGDRDRTLWGGFMISDGFQKVYFAGDTGYNQKMFDDIREKHPQINLSFIPIGAYKPKWFMSPIHISPEEAVVIHKQVNSLQSVGMHFGTFPLADDGQFDPAEDLLAALKRHEVNENDFILLAEGEKLQLLP